MEEGIGMSRLYSTKIRNRGCRYLINFTQLTKWATQAEK